MALVSVEYEYEYKTRSGRLVSIKPNERYVLVSKSNEHWWHVRRDQHTQPFYVPAQYVKELSAQRCPGSDESGSAERVAKATHVIRASDSRETHRFSTFGLCVSLPDAAARESLKPKQTLSKTENSSRWFSVPAAGLKTESRRRSNPRPADQPREKQPETAKQDEPTEQTPLGDGDVDFPLPPPPPPQTCCAVPEINITEFDSFPEPPDFVGPDESASKQQQQEESLDQTAGTTLKTENQVQNESLHTAVYVNVAQLRQSLSESPPSDPSPCSPSYLSQEGWEVHVDQESGQEYYYHPVTGRTTWDNPFSDSPTDPKHLPAEEPCFPSPLQSPVLSTSPASRLSSDWEQLVDETSGRPYFYNPTSGETSWEPPEQQSPYPLLMEPMSVHRFHDDGPPPLPEEDYPPEDYPGADQTDSYEDLNAAGPPTLPKEYAFTHVSRTLIPRANLDRTTPPGWNLTVEPNGTWVFTNENSPDQWIKSMDEQGQSYYYLRDGSRSQWNLPEAPVGPSHFGLENDDDEAENVPVIKNWRDSKGSVQFSSTQDDGRFVPTHTRNTSDYSSDSSSTGNSPETQHFVPNLEKAGILNKTKVCEKGKKVKKNWTPTWTVLRGGVLTFHKDPKSTGGAVNKTNQIVPEISVELKGATINKATKDKSSKKNVLELKGKNGVEFLLQNDTESIIADWLKILVDTIRQLEYQEHHSEDEEENAYEKIGNPERDDKAEKRKSYKPPITPSPSNAGETDPKKVRTKLMKLLMKRPTLQSVKDKGYIRETVFGCHLVDLCAQENTTVPSFVDKCIKAVEKRGLDIDGLYRVSGNLAVIQKLRFKADHEELDLEDGQWEDVHVITGALKLFFRELPDPLFPFSHFNKFVAAIRITDYKTKLSHVRDLVKSLPPSNHDTMKLLFGHLQRVIDCGENNRMTVQNVAIVFGPTLLRPEMESANITMHMVFQNQIVEFILNEYDQIFHFG